MSLKAVHLIFVTALSSLSFGVGVWKARDYFGPHGTTPDLLFALGAFMATAMVLYYGRYFLRKMKSIGYL